MKLTARISRDNTEWVWHFYPVHYLPPIVIAAYNKHYHVVDYLMENDADIHIDNDKALTYVSALGLFDMVYCLISHGANVNTQDCEALQLAAQNGHYDVVEYLVEKGIRCRMSHALLSAVQNDHHYIVSFLAENGADVHANNNEALRWAAVLNHIDIVEYIENKK